MDSIYVETLWVLILFSATALLREAVGELSVHIISKTILTSSYVPSTVIDLFSSCSNNGRSLGFGSAWRMRKNDPAFKKYATFLPLLCWVVGMPIKLVSVQAVRGGNPVLGQTGTWFLGIFWISFAVLVKIAVMFVDIRFGVWNTSSRSFISYRKLYQNCFCSTKSRLNIPVKATQDNDYIGFELFWEDGNDVKRLHLILAGGEDVTKLKPLDHNHRDRHSSRLGKFEEPTYLPTA